MDSKRQNGVQSRQKHNNMMESRTINMVMQRSRMGVDGNGDGGANKRIEEFVSDDEEDSEDRSIGK